MQLIFSDWARDGFFWRGFELFVNFQCNFCLSFISLVVYLEIFGQKCGKGMKSLEKTRKKARKNNKKR